MNHPLCRKAAFLAVAVALVLIGSGCSKSPTTAGSGDSNKNYFGATKPGAWAKLTVTSPDGSKSIHHYERDADSDGQAVIEKEVKTLAGPGKDSVFKNTLFLPPDFNFERDGLSYGKLMAKQTMSYGGAPEMPVNAKTLEVIKQSSKDYRGALTFEASENIDGRRCDRFSYSLKINGPTPMQETGHLWLDPSVPFGIVRQAGRLSDSTGKLINEYEMRLTEAGVNQPKVAAAPPVEVKTAPPSEPAEVKAPPPPTAEVKPARPAPPAVVTLAEGFNAARVKMEIEVAPGSSGRQLRLTLVNKTEEKLTVNIPAGDLTMEVSSPLNTLHIAVAKALQVVIPAGESAEPVVVEQRGERGITGGHCTLSVYEGEQLFSGAADIGPLPK